MMQKYTAEEVRRHNHEGDLWIVLHGQVYDLTKFLKEHPGGEEVLINLAGQDGTTCFDDIGHSEEAKLLKDSYKIGEFEESTGKSANSYVEKEKEEPKEIDDNWIYEEPKKENSHVFFIFIGAAVSIYAIIFYYMFN